MQETMLYTVIQCLQFYLLVLLLLEPVSIK